MFAKPSKTKNCRSNLTITAFGATEMAVAIPLPAIRLRRDRNGCRHSATDYRLPATAFGATEMAVAIPLQVFIFE